jgi:hypothetical protein
LNKDEYDDHSMENWLIPMAHSAESKLGSSDIYPMSKNFDC